MRITLVRVGSSELGTFGVLRYGQVPFTLTLEEPWKNNAVGVSSIPVGLYRCTRVSSPKFGDTFEVTNVPGRTHILFHKGNTLDDTQGCILVAEEFGGTFDRPVLVASQRGFSEFLALLDGQPEFELEITGP